jgi:hypothetical protein
MFLGLVSETLRKFYFAFAKGIADQAFDICRIKYDSVRQ